MATGRGSGGAAGRVLWAAAVLAAAGCAPRYWVPTREQMGRAEYLAKGYVLRELSDQAGTPAADIAFLPQGGTVFPVLFTVGGTPYARYRVKFWGGRAGDRRVVHVQYFDPVRLPEWDRTDTADGAFPAYFSVAVDVDAGEAVGHDAPGRGGGPGP